MPELLEIPFSPWSEKARWALQITGVQYTSRVYRPLIDELALRKLLGRWSGRVSVPVLRDGDAIVEGSLEIARWADRATGGGLLFPVGEEARVVNYSDLSERAMAAGRALGLPRLLASPEALLEMVPRPLRARPRVATALASFGVRRTLRKYQGHRRTPEESLREVTDALDVLRYDLAQSPSRGEPRTLLAELSYADVAMAGVLVCVRPPSSGIRMGPASRAAFELPGLAARYADLLGWRDALYARYRRP
ncbi:MAG: glutathione S-transferase N-terminal domain-containing protein [Polyangiales bacterium]